jgi:hypothetical protein
MFTGNDIKNAIMAKKIISITVWARLLNFDINAFVSAAVWQAIVKECNGSEHNLYFLMYYCQMFIQPETLREKPVHLSITKNTNGIKTKKIDLYTASEMRRGKLNLYFFLHNDPHADFIKNRGTTVH